MLRETHYTLSEAFELIGRHLHGDAWTGDEADVSSCWLYEDDIVMLQARAEKAVEPSRSPGGSGSDGAGAHDPSVENIMGEIGAEGEFRALSELYEGEERARGLKHQADGAPEQIMSLYARARDEQTELINIIRVEVAAEMLAKMGPEEEVHPQLVFIEAQSKLELLWIHAQQNSIERLRSGGTLSEAHSAILYELEKEYHAKERRESVVPWITKHAWSGDGSDAALTGYIFTPDDGKTAPIKAHCWKARSFTLLIRGNKATMDDQPWPEDGVLVFLKSQLDAILGDPKVVTTPPDDQLQRAAEPHESSIAAPGGRAEEIGTTGDCLGRKKQREEKRAMYRRWYDISQEIKADNKSRRPIEIARLIAKKETKAGNTKANEETIKRRLNQYHRGWAD